MAEYKHASIRGASLAYREEGKDHRHIILVHANLSDIRSWDAIFPLLAKESHVVAYSRRYAWPNDSIPSSIPDPWEEQAEDLAEMIRVLHLAPCNIVGNSTGATLAVLVAKKYPDLVASLFLEEPPIITIFLPRTPPTVLDVLSLLWRYPWDFFPIMSYGIFTIASATASFKVGKDEEALQTFLHGVVETDAYRELADARVEQARVNLSPHKALFCFGSLPLLTEGDLRRIDAMAYSFEAERTAGAQKSINAALARLMPNVKGVYFENASHFLHEDDPLAIADAIISRI